MKTGTKLRIALGVEAAIFIAVLAGISTLSMEKASDLWLFELLGAVSATMITTYGLYKMQNLT
jgi:hypothetical protein